jgi:hypothetical protein
MFWKMFPGNPAREFRARRTLPIQLRRILIVLMKRFFTEGLPPWRKDLIDEMREWIIQTSGNGDTPDESTIRRRIRAVWNCTRNDRRPDVAGP